MFQVENNNINKDRSSCEAVHGLLFGLLFLFILQIAQNLKWLQSAYSFGWRFPFGHLAVQGAGRASRIRYWSVFSNGGQENSILWWSTRAAACQNASLGPDRDHSKRPDQPLPASFPHEIPRNAWGNHLFSYSGNLHIHPWKLRSDRKVLIEYLPQLPVAAQTLNEKGYWELGSKKAYIYMLILFFLPAAHRHGQEMDKNLFFIFRQLALTTQTTHQFKTSLNPFKIQLKTSLNPVWNQFKQFYKVPLYGGWALLNEVLLVFHFKWLNENFLQMHKCRAALQSWRMFARSPHQRSGWKARRRLGQRHSRRGKLEVKMQNWLLHTCISKNKSYYLFAVS